MIEWKQMSRSIRYETSEIALDVWPVREHDPRKGYVRKCYRFTVFSYGSNSYLGNGLESSQDLACERALVVGGL